MGDLNIQTTPKRCDSHRFQVEIDPSWKVWGPNGGYLSSLLLRAVGMHTDKALPVSFSGHYLRVPAFGPAIVEVEAVKEGGAASAYSVRLRQAGKVMLQAQVWVANRADGLEHQALAPPRHFVPLREAGGRPPVGPMPFWDNLEIRQVCNAGGHYGHWYRFVPEPDVTDPFVDAARSLVLIDSMQWPARYFMDDRAPAWVAPSLDLYVQFHRFSPESGWLYSDALSTSGCNGLVAGCAAVWDQDGQLLASGGSQSALRPARLAG